MLARPTVIRLAALLGLEDGAFLIGGQALNLWAERYYAAAPDLAYYGPFTSKDIDYFGGWAAAEKLAKALNGHLRMPDLDTATPNTAVVEAYVDGQHLVIDFLDHVLGVDPTRLERMPVNIRVPIEIDGEAGTLLVPVMHPVHCFQSRVANRYDLGRHDDTAERQLQAAPIVVGAYIQEMLANAALKEVHASIKELFAYLRSDRNGRRAHQCLAYNPIEIFRKLAADERLDSRYRGKTLGPMVQRLERVRSIWPFMLEGLFIAEPEE